MAGEYVLNLGGQPVGKVLMEQQGLYYRFFCRCRLSGTIPYRLYGISGNRREKIGVLIPTDGGFGLDVRLPAKRFPEGELSFLLSAREEGPPGNFIPISPEEPFAYISRLRRSFLAVQNGQVGIMERWNSG